MKLQLKGLGEIGYVPDVDSYELAPNALTEVSNFRMRDGWAERAKGYRSFVTPSDVPYYMTAYPNSTQKFVVYCTRAAIWAAADTTTEITGPALTTVQTNKWTSTVLNGILVLNNGTDSPVAWAGDTATPVATITGWTSGDYCRSMRSIRYHLVALGTTESGTSHPHRVKWSAAAEPGTQPASWAVTDPTNDAGQEDVQGDGILVDALPMGDQLVLYKERSCSLMTYVGGNDVFSIQPLPDPVGMLAPNCGCVVPGVGHVVLTQGDVVAYNLQGYKSILDGKAKKWLRDTLDTDYFAASFVVANFPYSEVWICFPEVGNSVCTMALVWNWQTEVLSKRVLPNATFGCPATFNYATETYDTDSVTFNSESVLTFNDTAETFANNDVRLLTCTTGSKVYIMDSTDQADGVDFTGYVERTGLDGGDPQTRKHLKKAWPKIDAATGAQISVYLGASSDPETAPTYQSPVTFTVGTDQWIDAWAEGRFLAYKLSSTSWFRIRSMDLEIEPGGLY